MIALYVLGLIGALASAIWAATARRAWIAQAALGGVWVSLAALALARSAGPVALALALGGVGIVSGAWATGAGGPSADSPRARCAAWALGAWILLALLVALLVPAARMGAADAEVWRGLASALLGRFGPAAVGVALLGLAVILGVRRKED